MLQIPCVIFAGGKSSRMGEDKALLPFAGFNTLTEFQLTRLKKIFKTVYISCKNKEIFDFLKENENANFIEDIKTDSIYAPTLGFISVFNHIKEDSFFAISVDSPFVDITEIETLLQADTKESDATIAKTDFGIHPMCGIYHRTLEEDFINMNKNNNHKLGYLLKNSKTTYVYFEDEKPFLNINNPHEYKKALTLI